MPISTEQDEFNIHESLYKIKKPIKQFSICSKIINEKIVFEEPEKKEKLVQVLQKQNLTFKKELALFRKQNTQLKK